ncbi:MAG TPA: GAF domain-containing protein [Nitrososphaeraceae archaeon]|nr:GAF domain-containing protein [Nitrososphaeraceae archaeon]
MIIDEIDKVILSSLSKNARTPAADIANNLKNIGYKITERAIRYRLKRLEENNIVLGYSAIFNPSLTSEKISRTVTLKFRFTKDSHVLIERLNRYVEDAAFCVYSARLTGDLDWISHFIFDSVEQYELESDNFLHRFAELIADYHSYESDTIKASPYMIFDEQQLNERKWRVYRILNSLKKHEDLQVKLQLTVESLVKYFDAKFARIWLLDRDKKNLILKFSAGMYKNIDGEFSKVSVDSNKIGPIVKTQKPAITNDVPNDPRIRHPDWAKKEKLRSFAGYPIIHRSKSIGVLGMFSEKYFSPADFELLGIFCDQVSKELSNLFELQEFLMH